MRPDLPMSASLMSRLLVCQQLDPRNRRVLELSAAVRPASMCSVWSPRRLFSADRSFDPERLRRELRWRTVVIVLVALVSLVMGAANGDRELTALGVLSVVVGIPYIRFFYRWRKKAGEQSARRDSDS